MSIISISLVAVLHMYAYHLK